MAGPNGAYWIGAAVSLAWLSHFGPQKVRESYGGFNKLPLVHQTHIVLASITLVSCLANHLLVWCTSGRLARRSHAFFGWLAGMSSILGVVEGTRLVLSIASGVDDETLRSIAPGLAALSIAGAVQVFNTLQGIKHIRQAKQSKSGNERKRLVRMHQINMVWLHYAACLGPAWSRLPVWLGLIDPSDLSKAMFFSFLPPFILIPWALKQRR